MDSIPRIPPIQPNRDTGYKIPAHDADEAPNEPWDGKTPLLSDIDVPASPGLTLKTPAMIRAVSSDSYALPTEEPVAPTMGKGYAISRVGMKAITDDDDEVTSDDLAFNNKIDALDLLRQMGFKGDSVYRDEQAIRIFCPVHHDQIRRSMIIDPTAHNYRCTLKTCPAFRGGTLLELYALVKDITPREARRRLSTGQTSLLATHEMSLVEEAQDHIESGDYKRALPLLQQAVELSPKNEVTRCRLAALQLEMGLRDDGVSNYLVAAEDYGVRGELDKTLQIYNLLVLMSPNDLDIHEQMAYIAVRLGNIEDALQKLKWITNVLIEAGQFDNALLRVNRMLELSKDNTDFLMLKADLLTAAGHPDTAAQHVALSVQQLASRNQLAGALRLAEKGIEIAPHNNLLQLLYQEVQTSLQNLGLDLDQLRALQEAAAGTEEDDDDFGSWIASIEEEIGTQSALAAQLDNDTADIDPTDPIVQMCRNNLSGADGTSMRQMYDHLKAMYAEVQKSHEDGTLSDFEKKVIQNFYRSFCRAFMEAEQRGGGSSRG